MGEIDGKIVPACERLVFANLTTARRWQRDGRLDEARALLAETLQSVPEDFLILPNPSDLRRMNLVRLTARAKNALGEMVNDAGESGEAIRLFHEAKELSFSLYRLTGELDDAIASLFAVYNSAVAYEFLGEYLRAEELLRWYIGFFDDLIREKGHFWPAEKISDRRADCLNGLAVVLLGQGRLVEAQRFALESLISRQSLPANKWSMPKLVMSNQVLAHICFEGGDFIAAGKYLNGANKARQKIARLWGKSPYLSEYFWLKGRQSLKIGDTSVASRFCHRAEQVAEDEEDYQRFVALKEEIREIRQR